MGVKSWCVMKITLRGAKYILQMTERVLQLQPRWWGWWDGEHGLGGLISGDTSGPLLHKINMTLFCLFWRGFYPFWEVFFTRLSVSSWAWAAFTYGFCCNVFRGAIPLFSCSDRYEGVWWPLQTARVTFTSRATINGTYLVRRVDSLRPRKYFYKQLFIFHPSQGAGVGPVNVWIEPIRGDSASA